MVSLASCTDFSTPLSPAASAIKQANAGWVQEPSLGYPFTTTTRMDTSEQKAPGGPALWQTEAIFGFSHVAMPRMIRMLARMQGLIQRVLIFPNT